MNAYTDRILHFGCTSNLGGVEKFVSEVSQFSNHPIDVVVASDNQFPFNSVIENNGGKIYRICPRSRNPIKYIFDIFKLIKGNPQIKIIHYNVNICSSIAPILIGKLLKRKCIIHSHSSNLSNSKFSNLLHFFNKKLIMFLTDKRIACSKTAGDFLFGKHSFEVIYNGINLKEFSFDDEARREIRNEFNIDNDSLVISHVGFLSYIKNQSFLIDIFKEINNIVYDSVLLIIGEGSDKGFLQNKVDKLNLNEKVVFAGIRTDVNKILSASDVFVFPSLFEGFPITLVEAQANDLLVLCSDTVTEEVKILDSFKFVSLNASAEEWANTALKIKCENRNDNCVLLKKKCLDAIDSIRKLDSIYSEIISE